MEVPPPMIGSVMSGNVLRSTRSRERRRWNAVLASIASSVAKRMP